MKWDKDRQAEEEAYGECDSVELRISIGTVFAAPMQSVDSFIHEISHAIYNERGLEDGDVEERVVSAMGTGWAQVFRDNPWLAGWITQGTTQ